MSSPLRYIAIEGPIGVGKTSLSRKLADHMGARLVLEEFDDNPFLRDFYDDPSSVAFQTQAYFLVARFKQQERLWQQDLFSNAVVSDYLFAKDRIFAYMNLSDAELALYEKIYELLSPRILKPDLVVYLQARPEILMGRVHQRGREYEKSVSPNYMEELMKRYNQFFFRYDETPTAIIETSDIDFVNNPQDFEQLAERILGIHEGRHEIVMRSSA